MELTFKEWLEQAGKALRRTCGLSYHDLADQPWHDWYDNGMTPEEAAEECLVNEGFPGLDDGE